MPALAGVMAILAETERSPDLSTQAQDKVSSAICYLTERLAALRSIADPTAPRVCAFNIPRGDGGRRGPSRTLMFDVARGLARRVPLTKLAELDSEVRPFLASLMVSAVSRAGQELVIPNDLQLRKVTRDQFNNMIAEKAGETYDNYGKIGCDLMGTEATSEELAAA